MRVEPVRVRRLMAKSVLRRCDRQSSRILERWQMVFNVHFIRRDA
jgi:hypothetical protein